MELQYGNAVVIDGAEVSLTEQIDGGEVSLTRQIDGGEVGDSFVPLPHITIGEVETLPAGSEATATMTGTAPQPILNLGLVQGEKGEKGDKGDAGSLASVTATIDANIGTPSVDVEYDGENAQFNFHNLKGQQGSKGDPGDKGDTGNGIDSAELNSDYTLTLEFTDGTSYTTPSIRGQQGEKGDTGDAAGFGNVTASVDANVGTPSVTVTPSGSDTAKNFAFAFHNLKGVQGEKGETGAAAGFGAVTASVDANVGTPSVVVTTGGTDTAKTFNFAFHNLKGADGSGAVISVNGKDGNVVLDAEDVGALPDTTVIPSKTSDLTNDSGFISKAIYYGTCASAAADTTKVVTCADFTSLTAGSAILVEFSTTNTAAVANLMLNVNSTGAKGIRYINNGTLGNLSSAGYLKANTTYLFVYDGDYWVAYFNYNTTYSSMTDAEITAGTGTTARTITPARLKTAVQTWDHVKSVNGQTGDVVLAIPTVPTTVSSFTNDAGYLTLATLPIWDGSVT